MKHVLALTIATVTLMVLVGTSVHKYDTYTDQQKKAAQVAAAEREHQLELAAKSAKAQADYQICKARLIGYNNLTPATKAKTAIPVCTAPL